MKNKLLYITLLLLLSASACNLRKPPGSGLYFFQPVNKETGLKDTTLPAFSFLELRPDGSYTQYFGRFDYGSWNLKEQQLFLTNQRHRTYVYQVRTLTAKTLDLKLDNGSSGYFHVHSLPGSRPGKDPFSTVNNQWRIPPVHNETDAQLRERLLNHCQFWEAYFSWAQDQEEGAIRVADIPSPLKIYGNGFGLKHYADLPKEWQSCFYDTADCHKADTMIKHAFKRHNIAWPVTKDDLKKLIYGTQQVQDWLK